MPQLGEVERAGNLGYKGNLSQKYIWVACVDCGKERWVSFYRSPKRCSICSFRLHQFRGLPSRANKHYDKGGYVLVGLKSDDFFYPMVNSAGLVREHRLVMAEHLGINLHLWEIVHHKNGVRDDNRIENLQLVSDDKHNQITILENRIAFLEKRVTLLEAENELLKAPATQRA